MSSAETGWLPGERQSYRPRGQGARQRRSREAGVTLQKRPTASPLFPCLSSLSLPPKVPGVPQVRHPYPSSHKSSPLVSAMPRAIFQLPPGRWGHGSWAQAGARLNT